MALSQGALYPMVSVHPVIQACWLIFILYWALSIRSLKPTQETGGWLWGNGYQNEALSRGVRGVPAAHQTADSICVVNISDRRPVDRLGL